MATATFIDVPVDSVDRNPGQPRAYFDEAKLDELAGSIAANGLLQPLTVTPNGDRYTLVAGERRWRACQLAGLLTAPARVLTGLDDVELFVLAVTENVTRADMTPMEEAKAYAQLLAAGKTDDDVATLFGKTTSAIRWRVDLLSLRDDIQQLVERGQLPVGLAWYVAQLSPVGQQTITARYAQGRYRDDREATAVAKAMKDAETVVPMFEVQDWTPPAKPEPKPQAIADVATAVADAARLTTTLTALAGRDTDDLVDLDALAAALDQLKTATAAARRQVRTARARQLATDPT